MMPRPFSMRWWAGAMALAIVMIGGGWWAAPRLWAGSAAGTPERTATVCLPGGPLAGWKLPLFPTQHGERPGHPGCLPGKYDADLLAPEVDLYPGSVEHWRAYMFKYMPIRSFFDRQSLLRNWVAPDLPGAEPEMVEQYAAPLYFVPRHEPPVNTGLKVSAVPVVRMRAGTPTLRLDLGDLDIGVYAVRLIGAVETAKLRPFREPLFLSATTNEGPGGQTSRHRLRLGYCDEFYSVAEVYLHAAEKRRYRMELAVDQGSKVDLLVHNVTLDDVLAGVDRRAIKTRTTLAKEEPPAPRGPQKALDDAARRARDAAIWNALPPTNRQGAGHLMLGGDEWSLRRSLTLAADKPAEEIESAYGRWERPGRFEDALQRGVLLVNRKLGLEYTMEDLRNHRPLPDPYPYKDDGAGLYWPDPEKLDQGRMWAPIGMEVSARIRDFPGFINAKTAEWLRTGNPDSAHDAAIALARWAYAFPTIDFANTFVCLVRDPGPYGRDYRCRRRETVAFYLSHYATYVRPILYDYDRLFAFLRGNQRLAESVGRFVPWVRTPQDLIQLIDTHLVQITAKRILRYHYHTDPMEIANLAAVVGNTAATDPWMEWLFSRTFIYPLPVAGIQDVMITGTTREGTEIVGSTYYAQEEGASRVADALDAYRSAGGNPKYDLSDPARFPKPSAHVAWRIDNVVAGWDFLRIGDVAGPDKKPGFTLSDLSFAGAGWRWTRDPMYAFILKHYGSGEERERAGGGLDAAAARQARAPWLENRSRVLPMWAGVLETGLEHDDPRFRRAAYLRIGYGTGHQHDDTLDLQVVAHGLPMTIDGGQRGGYSSPADRTTRVHNTLEVDGRGHSDHSWVTALADHRGARYLAATATPPAGAAYFRRQIALVDVDEGRGAQRLSIPQQRPGSSLPAEVITPNSYVFDVFRASGGSTHTYCFHGPLDDDFQWNATGVAPPAAGSPEAEYLRIFKRKPEWSAAGTSPDTFQATWRYAIEVQGPGAGEKEMLAPNYSASSPRKFTRLHVLSTPGARALRAKAVCSQWGYEFTNLMLQRHRDEGSLESAIAAVVEPFAGEPFIRGIRRLEVVGTAGNARQALAVEVKTNTGTTDICFADGDPSQDRAVREAGMRAAGEFAFYSADSNGLRQATIAGGTLLDTPLVRIEPAVPERVATVTKVDYPARRLTIDGAWPSSELPLVFEIGTPAAGHMTTYTAARVEPAEGGTAITMNAGADYYRSAIEEIHPDGTLVCTLKPLIEYVSGCRRAWVASDDGATRFWRAECLGNRTLRLSGGPVDRGAFGPQPVLRLWEYGAGDRVRHSTSVSLRRAEDGTFILERDVDATVRLRAARVDWSRDANRWEPLSGQQQGEWFVFRAGEGLPTSLRLRW